MARYSGSLSLPECDKTYWRDKVDCKLCNQLLLVPCCCGLSVRDRRDHCRTCGHVVCKSQSCSRAVSTLKSENMTKQAAKTMRICDYCWLFHFVCFDPTQTDNVVTGDTFNRRQRKGEGKTTSQGVVWLSLVAGSIPVVNLCWRKLKSKKFTSKSKDGSTHSVDLSKISDISGQSRPVTQRFTNDLGEEWSEVQTVYVIWLDGQLGLLMFETTAKDTYHKWLRALKAVHHVIIANKEMSSSERVEMRRVKARKRDKMKEKYKYCSV